MFKAIKICTAVAFLFTQTAFAGATFERVKEEFWFKGEAAIHAKATYDQLGERTDLVVDPQAAWEEWSGTMVMPEELETGLALWIAEK